MSSVINHRRTEAEVAAENHLRLVVEKEPRGRRALAAMPRPRHLKTSELVARELAAYIVKEKLPEGAMLPTERLLAESLGIGRTTMREALRLLETRGVLTIRPGPGGGPVIRRPRPNDLTEALTLMLEFESATYLEVIQARTWLEPSVARAATPNIDQAVMSELVIANQAIAANGDDAGGLAAGNRRFHSIIADSCGNVLLQIFMETLIRITGGRALAITYKPRQVAAIVESHGQIIRAFERQDPDAAEAAMQAHLDESEAYCRRKFADILARPIRWTA
jgi:DNA-binding FadR family transcriptional regulator